MLYADIAGRLYLKIASDRKSRIFISVERALVRRSKFDEMQCIGDSGCAPDGNKDFECNSQVKYTLEIFEWIYRLMCLKTTAKYFAAQTK